MSDVDAAPFSRCAGEEPALSQSKGAPRSVTDEGGAGTPQSKGDRDLPRRPHPPRSAGHPSTGSGQALLPQAAGEGGTSRLDAAYAAAAAVVDPEIPVLTIADLGVLRDVAVASDGAIEVTITPTYSGCPAMDVIGLDIETALTKAGFPHARIKRVLAPAWTTDWLTQEGRAKLKTYGIAPPSGKASRRALFGEDDAVDCPLCGSHRTEKLAEFGSTACKALWRCKDCREPFDYFRCH